MAELSPILHELETLYSKLNRWKGLDLGTNPPIIALSSKGRKRTQTGWYTPAKWVNSQDDTLDALAGVPVSERKLVTRAEIVIATELLDDPVSTAAELYKQALVHNLAESGQINTVVGAQGYYPIAWERLAQMHNFIAEVLPDQPSRGWAGFRPKQPEVWTRWVTENMDINVFEVSRKSDASLKRAGSRMKKWQCDCTVIRSATKVQANCFECGKQFWWAEKEPPPNDTYHLHNYHRDVPSYASPENIAAAIGGQVISPTPTMVPGRVYTQHVGGRK